MANVKFLLKEPNGKKDTLIYLFFAYNNLVFKYSTGEKIHPKFWNPKTQRARENRSFPEYPDFNTSLEKLATETLNFYRQSFINSQLPTPDQIREHLNRNVTFRAKLEPKAEKPTFFKFIQQFITEQKNFVKPNTLKGYVSTFNLLQKFAVANGKKDFDFQDITLEWFFDFVDYMYSPPLEFGVNYASRTVSMIRQFLNEATEREYNENKAFQSKKFRLSTEPVYDIYLDETELKKLLDFDLSDTTEGYRTVRDLFLIGCYTGLRFSDWSKVKPNEVHILDGEEFIKVTPNKTDKPISIPLHPIVKTIFAKYSGVLPPNLENPVVNRYLKDLGKWVGIDQITVLPSSKGGKRIDIRKPKFEFMQTHTARRSFATNAFLSGVEPLDIRKITGHSTERLFLQYIKVDADRHAVRISKTAFFQNPKTE